MCMFKAPSIQMPTVQYVGPTQAEIDAQNQALTDFETRLTANNKTFQDTVTNQITTANDATADLLDKIATMNQQTTNVQGGGGGGGLTSAPYAITTEDNVTDTELAQTTQAITKKDKPKGSLKITQSGIQSAAGAGVNYGV